MTIEQFINRDPKQASGFTQSQFKRLDALYLRAASYKALYNRAVDCDLDEGVASFTYYKTQHGPSYLQFIIRRVGPRTNMFELYLEGKGRILKSGVFEKAYARLEEEIEKLIDIS